MIIADIFVNSSSATTEIHDLLPRGASGLKVRFHFADSEWKHLSKTAVFRNRNTTIDTVVTDNCAIIPSEVLSTVLDTVEVGIYGTGKKRALIIPTVWTKLGSVASAAKPSGNTAGEYSLPYWAQIKEKVDILENTMMDQMDLENALIEAKNSGVFDGPKGEKGDQGDKGDTGPQGIQGIRGEKGDPGDVFEAPPIALNPTGEVIALGDSAERPLHGLTLYGKTTQNGTPTPEAPVPLESVGADGNVAVMVTTDNVLVPSDEEGYLSNIDGSVSTTSACGCSVYISCKAEKPLWVVIPNYDPAHSQAYGCRVGFYDAEKQWISTNKNVVITGQKQKIFAPSGAAFVRVSYVKAWQAALYFEDRNDFVDALAQTLTAQKPENVSVFLPGIPVSSGGNYTDENGQQWICDEVDFANGVYVQRVGIIESYANEEVSAEYMSTTGELSEGATVLYVLGAAIKTDLAAEEIAQYSALHTNYPNTIVYNDSGAGIGLEYVADTKMYIDNKFAELASAILNV